jgi:hypothetical protein
MSTHPGRALQCGIRSDCITPEFKKLSDDLLAKVFPIMGRKGLSGPRLAAEMGLGINVIKEWLSRNRPISEQWVPQVQRWLEANA